MLTFFRRIRKSLLEGGRTSKYLLYAVGEIALVVIGILIALQINNWNEWRKERIEESKYLERLYTDLKRDTAYLNQRIRSSEIEATQYYDFIHLIYQHQSTKEDFTKLNSLPEWSADHLLLQEGTYKELTGSGKLDIIEDTQLKEDIIAYYREYDIASSHIKEMNETGLDMSKYFLQHFVKYYEFFFDLFDEESMRNNDDWSFINDPESDLFRGYEGAAAMYYGKMIRTKEYCEHLLINALSNLERIEANIH